MKKTLPLFIVASLVGGPAAANDYPTLERVEYVLACAREFRGPAQEGIAKCSCVIDTIAGRLTHDQFIDYSTAANAFSIGGERGEVMRGFTEGKEMARTFRAVQAEARKSCFL